MIKNLTTNQLLLIALAAVLLLIAAFSFYLLQNPSAPLPFAPPPATATPTAPSKALVETAVQNTPTPTRRTSYTPLFAFVTPALGTPSAPPTLLGTPEPGTTFPALTPSTPHPATPSGTSGITGTPPSGTVSPSPTSNASPTATRTLAAGYIGVTGRVIQNNTPMPNVIVSFEDDVAPRQSTTNAGGHYTFVTLAPGLHFILTFKQSNNPGLTPTTDITPLAWIEGTLPPNTNPIDFQDLLEVSINLSGTLFQLTSPLDGAVYSASAISASTPLQFSWSLYSPGGSYKVEIGPNGSDQPTWVSDQLTSPPFMWNGSLTDGTHIVAGNYWWQVAVTKSSGGYVEVIYTHQYDLSFNP